MLLFYACDLQHLQGYVDVGGCLHSREDCFRPTRQQAWPLLVPTKTIITPSIIFQFLHVCIQDLFHHSNPPLSSRQGSYRALKSKSNSSHCFPSIPCSPLWIWCFQPSIRGFHFCHRNPHPAISIAATFSCKTWCQDTTKHFRTLTMCSHSSSN